VKTLVGWDNAQEAELLLLYLTIGNNEARACITAAELLVEAGRDRWDVVLLSQTLPTTDDGYAVFTRLHDLMPDTPIVLACRLSEMIALPRFLTHGLRSYIIRDERGDFIFLTLSSLESTIEAVRSERTRKLADRLREEMDGVRKMQETIIPRDIQSHQGFLTVARYEPSEVMIEGDTPVVMAGGDYYDVFKIDDETLVLLVGDASGHGLKACMSIVTMHTLIRMVSADRFRRTDDFVSEINRRLCENSLVQSGGGFITLFYAAIDTRLNTITWSSAGHPLAMLHNLDTDEVTTIGKSEDCGLPLGIAGDFSYTSSTIEFPLNHRLLIYSDGLTDAFSPRSAPHRLFGVEGITEAMKNCRRGTVADALDQLFTTSRDFTEGAGRHDDTSVVLVERHSG
jgi:sigma-B regulation protein RsbU (phosphoserine phosphatase)